MSKKIIDSIYDYSFLLMFTIVMISLAIILFFEVSFTI
jgi:hypothetical protein